jgi:hypothetical protein
LSEVLGFVFVTAAHGVVASGGRLMTSRRETTGAAGVARVDITPVSPAVVEVWIRLLGGVVGDRGDGVGSVGV